MKESNFGSFVIIEDHIENNTPKKVKLKSIKDEEKNEEKKRDKIINNKNPIFLNDEKGNKHQIINDYFVKEEVVDNSFLKKNDFCIYTKESVKKEDNSHQRLNNDDFGSNSISKYFKIEEEENNDNSIRRSNSSNINDMAKSIIYIKKIKNKNSNNKVISDFVNIIEEKNNPDPFEANCILYDKKNKQFNGKLTVDQKFKCIFHLDKNCKKDLYYNKNYYSFSLLEIRNYYTKNTNYYFWKNTCIEIDLKDYRYFILDLKKSYSQFIDILDTFATPGRSCCFYKNAFFRFIHSVKKYNYNGWDIYDFEKEFKRQNIDFKFTYDVLDNSKFLFCPSYPKKFIVPKMNRDDLEKCSFFRTKKRMPTLTYKHKNGCCIWRSSQTRSGFTGKNKQDQTLMTKITEGSKKIIIYDARPMLNAMANKLKGAGYENPNNYTNIKMEIIFCGIPNIHAVRSSFEKMYTMISYNNDNDYNVISNLQNTSWYETIILILKGGFQIYNSILDNWTVLIHCSDGWDRTAQLSCISQLLLDKYYRTLEGFIILIEKDWLSFGHQFRFRNGFYSSLDPDAGSENQFSPIFIQWLDCVYQIMSQNYSKFEFNLNLLTFIASEVYTGKYGTFLFNNEKEREQNNAKTKTISIWSEVMLQKKYYLNPIYDPNNNEPITINYKKIKFWDEYFYRYEKGEQTQKYLKLFNKKVNEYEKKMEKKQNIIDEMAKYLINKSVDLSIFSEDCKNEIKNYLEKCNTGNISFEILNPSESVLKMKDKK